MPDFHIEFVDRQALHTRDQSTSAWVDLGEVLGCGGAFNSFDRDPPIVSALRLCRHPIGAALLGFSASGHCT